MIAQTVIRSALIFFIACFGTWICAALPVSSRVAVSYTASQASSGEKPYEQHCSACHGRNLDGASAGPLAGADFKAINKRRHATVGDVFEIMRTQMPLNAPASLTQNQYVAIFAFILKANTFKSGTKPLTFESARTSTDPFY